MDCEMGSSHAVGLGIQLIYTYRSIHVRTHVFNSRNSSVTLAAKLSETTANNQSIIIDSNPEYD